MLGKTLFCYLGSLGVGWKVLPKRKQGGELTLLDRELNGFAPQLHAPKLLLLAYPPVWVGVWCVSGVRAKFFMMIGSLTAKWGACQGHHQGSMGIANRKFTFPVMMLFCPVLPAGTAQDQNLATMLLN